MKHQLAAGVTIFVAWTLLDVIAHRLVLAGLYESSPGGLWRPASEMSALPVTGVMFVLIAVFVAMYQVLVRPKSLAPASAWAGSSAWRWACRPDLAATSTRPSRWPSRGAGSCMAR